MFMRPHSDWLVGGVRHLDLVEYGLLRSDGRMFTSALLLLLDVREVELDFDLVPI
jgi:hypothetical protein